MNKVGALVGHRFPGGTCTVEHWENALFHHATGRSEVPTHGRVHHACAFHVPIRAAGTSISELFGLVDAEGPVGVGIDHYDFHYERPWLVGIDHDASGLIESVEEVVVETRGRRLPADKVTFRFDLRCDGAVVVSSRIAWWVFRSGRSVADDVGSVSVEDSWDRTADLGCSERVENVSGERMRLAAALLRDPYPIHWDPAASEAAGLGHRQVNQTPLNVAYIVNALTDWRGLDSIARLTMRFPGIVFAGDDVVATAGQITDASDIVPIRLDRDGVAVLTGSAQLRQTEEVLP